jgi:carbon monoxide dehydrogenase subunit G
MSQTVVRAITVRRPREEVAAFVTDPHRVLDAIPGFARFSFVGKTDVEGEEEWDVFLEVGTLHIGGRVLVRRPSPSRLEWRGERGTRHSFSMTVEPLGEHSRLTMHLEYSFAGLLMARVSEMLGRGIAARHLEAGLEQVRHLLEHGDAVGAR